VRFLLLPGLEGTGLLFKWFVESAPEGCDCESVAYPTHTRLSYQECTDLVLEKSLPDGPFVIVAESFSGPVAILAAARKPEGLAAIVLCNTFAKAPAWNGYRLLPWPLLFRVGVPWLTVALHLTGFRHASRFIRDIRDANSRVAPEIRAHRLRSVLSVDVRPELAGLSLPILYLRGTHDRLISRRSLDRVVAANPGTEVARIPGPHLLLQVAPADCWQAIGEFLAGGSATQIDPDSGG
jgi:pimeloyl-ACP methyl ester carboxylesterase